MPPQYVDDVGLGPDAVLWRSINPRYVKPGLTVSSAAYVTDRGLSVYVLAEISVAYLTRKFPGWPFQSFTAKVARDAGCILCKIPDDEGNEGHREIRRASNPTARMKPEGIKIRDAAACVYHDDVPIPVVWSGS